MAMGEGILGVETANLNLNQVGQEMPLVSRENRLVRAEAIIPQRSEEKVLDMTKTVHTPTITMRKPLSPVPKNHYSEVKKLILQVSNLLDKDQEEIKILFSAATR